MLASVDVAAALVGANAVKERICEIIPFEHFSAAAQSREGLGQAETCEAFQTFATKCTIAVNDCVNDAEVPRLSFLPFFISHSLFLAVLYFVSGDAAGLGELRTLLF